MSNNVKQRETSDMPKGLSLMELTKPLYEMIIMLDMLLGGI